MRLSSTGESEMESGPSAVIGGRPHSSSISLHDRTRNGEAHPGALWFSRMKRIKNQLRSFGRQSYTSVADGNGQLAFGIDFRTDGQCPTAVFHGFNSVH